MSRLHAAMRPATASARSYRRLALSLAGGTAMLLAGRSDAAKEKTAPAATEKPSPAKDKTAPVVKEKPPQAATVKAPPAVEDSTPAPDPDTFKPAPTKVPPDAVRITLRGSDLPLGSVLGQIARSANLVLVADKDVQLGRALESLSIDDLPLETALLSLLTPHGLSFSVSRGLLRVFVYETRTFKVAVPVLVQEWETSISNEGGQVGAAPAGGGGQPGATGGGMQGGLGARVGLKARSDTKGLWEEVESALSRLIATDGSFSVNRVAGFATVRTPPFAMASVAAYFQALNEEMGRTVVVETKVLQINLRDTRSVGLDWKAVISKLSSAGVLLDMAVPQQSFIPASAGLMHFSGQAGDAFVRALEDQGDLHLVAQPTLVLGNNLPAIIDVGTVLSFVSQQTTTVSGQGGLAQTTVQTSSLTDGLILSVLPRVLENGEITLAVALVAQDVIELRRESFGASGFVELPRTSRRAYNGVVRARMGESLVIGGLISDRNEEHTSRVPVLSRIPFIGWLFGATETKKVRSELVVTITVREIPGQPWAPARIRMPE